jgi:protease YdgD
VNGFVALALSLALIAAPAAAVERDTLPGVLGEDDRVILDSVAWPWAAIGRVNRAGRGFCTGALVAPNIAVTAAHCVYDDRGARRLAPHEITFLPGYRRGQALAAARPQTVVVPAEFRTAESPSLRRIANDWALLILERPLAAPAPLPVRPLPAERGGSEAGRQMLNAGYQQDRAHLLSLHAGCEIRSRIEGDRVIVHTCDATLGASGSPLLIRSVDGYVLIGIVSGSVDTAAAEHGFAVDAEAFAAAIAGLAGRRR